MTLSSFAVLRRRAALALGGAVARISIFLAIALFNASTPWAAATDVDLQQQAREVESYLHAFPQRALVVLDELSPRAAAARPEQQRLITGLYAQAMVLAGRTADAQRLADRLESDAVAKHDDAGLALALLTRSVVASWIGNPAQANTSASEARRKLRGSRDLFLSHWAALAVGNTARQLGLQQDAAASLREALAYADEAKDPNRRSATRYVLSLLDVATRQPEQGLAEASEAFSQAQSVDNVYAMARAKLAAADAYDALNNPERELASVEDAVEIAHAGGSHVTEALALVKLTELRLRRREYPAALLVARQTLDVLRDVDDYALLATAKANLGFALLATGQRDAGKRLVDDALAEWERSQSTSGVSWLFGKYAQYLATAGDYKSALVMAEQERAWTVKYEAERHQHEVELLSRDNALQAAELQNHWLQQIMAWGIALVSASFLLLLAILYRKLQTINRLEAEKNQQLNLQSTRDPLTTLFNRRYFENLMESEGFQQDRRRSGDERIAHALLLIDLDHFKEVNDRYGHAAGDAVLVEVARRLQSTLRESDVCVRWGGEEFLIFAPATHPESLKELASRIMRTIGSDPIAFGDLALSLTASIGYAPMPLPPKGIVLPWRRAIDLVDKACYMAKNHGRNCAFGVRALNRNDTESLAAAERDLEEAARTGIVEMDYIPGGIPSAGSAGPGNAMRAKGATNAP